MIILALSSIFSNSEWKASKDFCRFSHNFGDCVVFVSRSCYWMILNNNIDVNENIDVWSNTSFSFTGIHHLVQSLKKGVIIIWTISMICYILMVRYEVFLCPYHIIIFHCLSEANITSKKYKFFFVFTPFFFCF